MTVNQKNELFLLRLGAYLPKVNLIKLNCSLNSDYNDYAKEELQHMHSLFVEVHGDNEVDSSIDIIELPAVFRSRTNGTLCVGLVSVSPMDAGEHFGTQFFAPHGIVSQQYGDKTPENTAFTTSMIPYDYWYTPLIVRDYHHSQNEEPAILSSIVDLLELSKEPSEESDFDIRL